MTETPINWTVTTDDDTFNMDGTEKTKRYKGVVKTSRGQLGVRFLPNEGNPTHLRIRLEPTGEDDSARLAGVLPAGDNPTVPDESQPRYSVVVPIDTDLAVALAPAVAALTHGAEFARYFTHPNLPSFHAAPVTEPQGVLLAVATTGTDEKAELLTRAKQLKIKGACSRWGVAALKAWIEKKEGATS